MEKFLTLKRISHDQEGTYGVLIDQTTPFALTLENPWFDNHWDISCIPNGVYHCVRIESPKFGDTFEITKVPNRTHILFHWGNTQEATQGCILIGEEFGYLNGKTAILCSKRGFNEFMGRLKDHNEFQLLIAWV